MPSTVVCADAIRSKRTADRNFARWEGMVQAIGLAFTLVTIVFIVALIWGNNPSKFATGASAVAASAGLALVLKRRSTARNEVLEAKQQLEKDCKGQRDRSVERGQADLNESAISADIYDALVD